MGAAETAEASVGMLSTTDRLKEGKKFQVLCPSILSPESRAKLYGCYAVIAVLTAAVIALTVTLSAKEKQVSMKTTYAVCPRGWIGFGSKCFYFSEDLYNWILSKNFCMKVEAQLARFDNQEELDFLMKFKGSFDYWIGLHRNSSSDPWRWADNTEYNNSLWCCQHAEF
ncbi:C-type lectin domain family 2 member D11-like isoform X2 [Peromyscus californicus insignis]|uniref:C-type lectin domain family 2 member D11-like isoform X2 n=1 Tax=Peromyscus californicus insignis TaxID=564181 RepID=UPI0022A7C3C7|nr:C-type lectin domain family 2 member D11-like isoform X2 [Peromyscus californicus insignis]